MATACEKATARLVSVLYGEFRTDHGSATPNTAGMKTLMDREVMAFSERFLYTY
jgi:hypothetical protein